MASLYGRDFKVEASIPQGCSQSPLSAILHKHVEPFGIDDRNSTRGTMMKSGTSKKRRHSSSTWPFGNIDALSKQDMENLPKRQKIHLKMSSLRTRCGYHLDDFLYSDNIARVTCLRCRGMGLGYWPRRNGQDC